MKIHSERPGSYAAFSILQSQGKVNYNCCVSCNEPFHPINTRTSNGWKETQISGMCENCFDNIFTEEEDHDTKE